MKAFRILGLSVLALTLANCAPSSKQLKDAVEKDPSIVFVAIEKDPEQFIEVVNKAAQNAQKKAQEKAMADEGKKRDEEFKNPLKPAIDDSRILLGNKDAKVTIEEVMKAYPNDVRVEYKHLPLDFHPMAMPAARYFEAVAMQGMDKATKFYKLVFENQGELRAKKDAFLKDCAKKAGADLKKVEKDLTSEAITKRIETDMEEAKKFEFSGTPGFLINGVSLKGAYPFSEFKTIIDKHLGK